MPVNIGQDTPKKAAEASGRALRELAQAFYDRDGPSGLLAFLQALSKEVAALYPKSHSGGARRASRSSAEGRAPQRRAPSSEEDWEEAVDLAEKLLDLTDELPERAEDFATSVRETTQDMLDKIREEQRCSSRQLAALENMTAGVYRWLENRR